MRRAWHEVGVRGPGHFYPLPVTLKTLRKPLTFSEPHLQMQSDLSSSEDCNGAQMSTYVQGSFRNPPFL